MTRESRVRLEGSLELVEQTLASMQQGLSAARRLDWKPLLEAAHLHESEAVRSALARVEQLSATDPELAGVLRSLKSCVSAAEQAVTRRAQRLRVEPSSLAEGLRTLVEEPVLYEGRGDRAWLSWGVMGFGVLAAVALGLTVPFLFPVALVPLFMLRRMPALAGMNVTVTPRRVLLRGRVVRVDEIESAGVVPASRDPRQPWRLVFQLHEGEQLAHPIAERDPSLLSALRRAGVRVDDSR